MARAHGATMSSSSASGNLSSMKKSICMPTTASAWRAPRLPDIWIFIIDCARIPALTGARQTRPTSIRRPSLRRHEFSAAGCWMRLRSGYRPPCVTPNTRRHQTSETRRSATYHSRETVQTTGASSDRPAASIKIGDFERLLHNANRTGGYETPMNGFAWRGIDLPEVDDIHCDRLGPALVDAVLRLDYFHAIKAHRELGLPRSPPRFGGQRQEGLARRRQRVDARKQKRIALNAAVLRRAQHKIDAGRAQGESREYVAFAVGDHRYLLRVRADLRRRARPLDPAPAFLLFDRPRPSLRLAPALALQKLSVDKTKNRPVLRVHRDCGMQIETAAARRSDDRRVLDRQHMPAHATRPGARAGGGEHLLGRHRLVAQKTGQTNFPSPIPAQPTHANPIAARRDKAAMQKDPPFSRRRSPNRPSPSSSIANLPTNQRRESDFKNHRNRRCVNAVARMGGTCLYERDSRSRYFTPQIFLYWSR